MFSQILEFLKTGRIEERPSNREIIGIVLRHARMLCAEKPEAVAMPQMRKHISWYLAGFPGASKLRRDVNAVTSLAELETLLAKAFPYAAR